MKKQFAIILVSLLMLPMISFADDPTTTSTSTTSTSITAPSMSGKTGMMGMTVDQRVQMHQDMIKVHQDAIDCLKASTDPKDCAKNFKTGMEQVRATYFPNAKVDWKKHCMMDNGMMENNK